VNKTLLLLNIKKWTLLSTTPSLIPRRLAEAEAIERVALSPSIPESPKTTEQEVSACQKMLGPSPLNEAEVLPSRVDLESRKT